MTGHAIATAADPPKLVGYKRSILNEEDEHSRPAMPLLRRILKNLDIAVLAEVADDRTDNLAQPFGSQVGQVAVLSCNVESLALRLCSVTAVGQARQVEELSADRSGDRW